MTHNITASEAHLPLDERRIAGMVQHAAPRRIGTIEYLRGVKPSSGTWFDLFLAIASAVVWFGTVFAVALFVWVHTN
jgi:hypothetical protein